MRVTDVLYGEYDVEEVLTELINSKELQRLKDIHMIGSSYLLNPLWNETRYEHSIGVMLLIRKLGGSLEEQIAGLLHDISHTVFSHVIDLVMKRTQEDYHEEIKSDYIQSGSIPGILEKYGFHYEDLLLDDQQWTILEQEAPLLCADRIDYTLREVYRYFDTPLDEIHWFLTSIETINDQLVVNQLAAGEWFVQQYYKVVLDLFYDPLNIYSYNVMTQLLTYAMEQHYLLPGDLMQTETAVLAQLTFIPDSKIQQLLIALSIPVLLLEVSSDEPYDIFQQKKPRFIDPLVSINQQISYTSALSEAAKRCNQEAVKRSEKGIFLRIQPEV